MLSNKRSAKSSQSTNVTVNNNSGVVKGCRPYDKPWTENARNPNAKAANT